MHKAGRIGASLIWILAWCGLAYANALDVRFKPCRHGQCIALRSSEALHVRHFKLKNRYAWCLMSHPSIVSMCICQN